MEAGYFGVYLWAQAVNEAGTTDVDEVRSAIKDQAFVAPGGLVCVDFYNNHTFKTVRIGKIQKDGQFDVVWSSETPVHPVPYPISRSKADWNAFLEKLYQVWDGNWANPGGSANFVDEKVAGYMALIQKLARDPVVVSAVQASNEESRTLTRDQIERLDRGWQDQEDDGFANQFLTNPAARKIVQLQDDSPEFKEIFICDAFGLIAAMSNKTADYDQADEGWWGEAYDAGKGRLFRGEMQYDSTVADWGIPLYVPVYSEQQEAIGVIKAYLSASQLREAKGKDRG
jgi:hypothetical protein